MKIKNIISGIAALLFAATLAGCYEKFDSPGLTPRYEDQWFTGNGYTIVDIRTVKDIFSDDETRLIDHQLERQGLPNASIPGASPTEVATYGRYCLIAEKYVIKGKVTSNDAFGNFYRSLFIQDETGEGIEVKVGLNGMFTKYKTGETIYVVCENLALGNYRSMLSLGLKPMPEDVSDSGESYANKYMEVQTIVDRHVKLGAETRLEESDIFVVTSPGQISRSLESRLVRFEGLTSSHGTWDNNTYPQFLHKLGFNSYSVFTFEEAMTQWQAFRDGGSSGERPPMPEPQNNYVLFPDPENPGEYAHLPSWGFQEHRGDNTRNYGSALFWMGAPDESGSVAVVVRTSGFARFALEPVTPDGRKADITAIVATYTDKNGGHFTYQLTINNVSDVVEYR